jgi:hypothetical protein
MQGEVTKERIEAAWSAAKEWFEAKEHAQDQGIHVPFGQVEPAKAQAALNALVGRAESYLTGSVWVCPEVFDPDVTGVDASFAALQAGNLAAVSLNYRIAVGAVSLVMILTVAREKTGALRARCYTEYGHFAPKKASPRRRFEALFEHATEVQALLGAAGFSIDPEKRRAARG